MFYLPPGIFGFSMVAFVPPGATMCLILPSSAKEESTKALTGVECKCDIDILMLSGCRCGVAKAEKAEKAKAKLQRKT